MSDGDAFAGIVRAGEVLLDKYRVERVLGAGGMGLVVAATHLALEQYVKDPAIHKALSRLFELVEVVVSSGSLSRMIR